MTLLKRMLLAALGLSLFSLVSATPPESSGNVVRFESEYFEWWYDAESDMTAYVGFDVVYFCTYFEFIGTEVPVKDVVIEDGVRYTRRFGGEALVSVYAGEPDCTNIWDHMPLAEGMLKFKYHDNDVEPWLNPDRHNMNSFGYNANGTLFSPTGERMHLLINWQAMWDGIDPESFREIFKMKLK